MLERFTDQARQVTVLAQEEARRLGHAYIGPEHLLLGIAGVSEGLLPDGARARVEAIIGVGNQPPREHIPYSPRAKTLFSLIAREAADLGHPVIGVEHILLGLLRDGDNTAALVLLELGADTDRLREDLRHR